MESLPPHCLLLCMIRIISSRHQRVSSSGSIHWSFMFTLQSNDSNCKISLYRYWALTKCGFNLPFGWFNILPAMLSTKRQNDWHGQLLPVICTNSTKGLNNIKSYSWQNHRTKIQKNLVSAWIAIGKLLPAQLLSCSLWNWHSAVAVSWETANCLTQLYDYCCV